MPVAQVGVSCSGPPELGLYDHEYLTSPLQWPLNKGGALMPQDSPCRPWQVIARELSTEPNSRRVLELSEELNRALESRNSVRNGKSDLADTNSYPTNELSIMQWLSCALIMPACRCCFQSGDQAGNYDCWRSVDSTLKPPSFGSGYAQTRRVHVESRSATRAEWLHQT